MLRYGTIARRIWQHRDEDHRSSEQQGDSEETLHERLW